MPICISLFAESFDAKLEESEIKKKEYLGRMIKEMYGTYDPEMMSKMPLTKKKPFNMREYQKVLRHFPL